MQTQACPTFYENSGQKKAYTQEPLATLSNPVLHSQAVPLKKEFYPQAGVNGFEGVEFMIKLIL